MADGIRTTNIPAGTLAPVEIIGHQEDSPGVKSTRRFPLMDIATATAELLDIPSDASIAAINDHLDTLDDRASAVENRATSLESRATALEVLAPDISKTIHIRGGVSGGDGSAASPYNGMEAIAAINADATRRSLKLVFKGTTAIRITQPFEFPDERYRNVEIISSLQENGDIYCSEAIVSGSAAFTQPDAGGNPNVWMTAHKWGTVNNSTTNAGGLVDIDHSSACGRTGVYRSAVTILTNIGPNIALATLNNILYRNCFSIHTAGTYAGKILVHANASADPNTINYERTLCEYAFHAAAPVGTTFNGQKITMNGVRVFYPGSAVWIDRSLVDIQNVTVYAARNYSFQLNQCDGIAFGNTINGGAADAFNGNGQIDDLSAPGHQSKMLLIGNVINGIQQMVVPPVLAQVVGDGFSAHLSQYWHISGNIIHGATKDGCSMVDSFWAENNEIDDCANCGILLASVSGTALVAYTKGNTIKGCYEGLMANAAGVGSTATIYAERDIFDSNDHSGLRATGSTVATVNAMDCGHVGTTPTAGDIYADGSGVINIRTPVKSQDVTTPTVTASTHTQLEEQNDIVFNCSASCTLTLLNPVTHKGRVLWVRTIAAFTVVSATANVRPLAGGAPATGILAATAGKWAKLKSDGAYWVLEAAN